MSSLQRIHGRRAYSRGAADALDPIAWRPPPARRFDARPANDVAGLGPDRFGISPPTPSPATSPSGAQSLWVVLTGGAVAAAALGALMGGMLSL